VNRNSSDFVLITENSLSSAKATVESVDVAGAISGILAEKDGDEMVSYVVCFRNR
jgi:hypothetical protein